MRRISDLHELLLDECLFTVRLGRNGEVNRYRLTRSVDDRDLYFLETYKDVKQDVRDYLGACVNIYEHFGFVPSHKYSYEPNYYWSASVRAINHVINTYRDTLTIPDNIHIHILTKEDLL